MAGLRATVGTWIRVPIAGDPWPVTMQIGDGKPAAAFIDHHRDTRGRITTSVARRCPNLQPGRYTVRVVTPDGVTETQLQVT